MEVLKYPAKILLQKCDPAPLGEETNKQLDEMLVVMKKENGIGLAANQVGINKFMFIMLDSNDKLIEFLNPQIVKHSEETIRLDEGCLSAPGVFVQIQRSKNVSVEATNRSGEKFTYEATGLEAVCCLHEIDHLNGIFFLDKATRQQKRAALRKLGL